MVFPFILISISRIFILLKSNILARGNSQLYIKITYAANMFLWIKFLFLNLCLVDTQLPRDWCEKKSCCSIICHRNRVVWHPFSHFVKIQKVFSVGCTKVSWKQKRKLNSLIYPLNPEFSYCARTCFQSDCGLY